MTPMILRIIGFLYGLFGVVSLVTFLIYLIYGPAFGELSRQSVLFQILFLGLALLNAILGLLVMYSFWTMKWWGRYLAIGLNALYLGAYLIGFFAGRITHLQQLTWQATLFLVVVVVVLAGLIILCFRREVKDLMIR